MNGGLLWLLLGGSISGVTVAVIARGIMPGKQRMTTIEMLVIGTLAGLVGGIIARLVGLEDEDGLMRFIPLAISVGLAILAIYFWTNFRNKKAKQAIVPGPVGGAGPVGGGSNDKAKVGKKDDKDGPMSGGSAIPGPM